MKTGLIFVGLLITTAVGAQMAPRSATLAQPGQPQVSPTAHLDQDAVAIDPRIEMLRQEVSELKRNQTGQAQQIAHLKHCVAELTVIAAAHQPHELADSIATLKTEDDDGDLNTAIAKPLSAPKRPDLGGCS